MRNRRHRLLARVVVAVLPALLLVGSATPALASTWCVKYNDWTIICISY